ncbi:MAG: DoxX family protein [Frankiaceae bacterium]|nr:DoxX family protein [Frankiaceae bacterium]MBV9872448.1 DoxX family protein [Frankiaceae bacterium]
MIRRIARALLGGAFISTGVDALKDIDRRVSRAEGYGVPEPVTTARAVAGAQIGAGVLLVLNRAPRLTAVVAALAVIPEAVTGHDFWTEKDPDTKKAQRSMFARDLGLLGGSIVTAVETGGRESVPHRAVRASRQAAKAAAEKVPVGD